MNPFDVVRSSSPRYAIPSGAQRSGNSKAPLRGTMHFSEMKWQSLFMASEMKWAADAEARMKRVPFFVRPMARRKAEAAAQERGMAEVTSALLDEIKAKEMPGG